jgi:hypothetical protein
MGKFRKLSTYEESLLGKLLDGVTDGYAELTSQLPYTSAKPWENELIGASITLKVEGGKKALIPDGVPVEAIYDNEDNPVSYILHVKDGYMQELEVAPYKELPTEPIPLGNIRLIRK